MIRVELPSPLRTLAGIHGEVLLDVGSPVTQASVLDAIEARYAALRGTMRDQRTRRRRDYIRFFACGTDLSHQAPDAPLPDAVVRGTEPFMVVGAIVGG